MLDQDLVIQMTGMGIRIIILAVIFGGVIGVIRKARGW